MLPGKSNSSARFSIKLRSDWILFNKNGESDYADGFEPNVTEINEYDYWNNTLPFGDENEAILKAALDNIRGISGRSTTTKQSNNSTRLETPYTNNKFENEMYINADFLSKTK